MSRPEGGDREEHTLVGLGALGTEPTMAGAPAAEVSMDATIAAPVSAPARPASAAGSVPPPLASATASATPRGDDYARLLAVDPQHYVIDRELAKGGMGRIIIARDRRLGRRVALKEPLHSDTWMRARFEREARITAKLQHPAIVNILEAGLWQNDEPFFAMRLINGESLDVAIAARTTLAARLELLPHVTAVIDALAYAHDQRIIHRDLKPANVLVGAFGETVVIDWGLAKDLTDTATADVEAGPYRAAPTNDGQTVAGAVMGTPAYMAPEQARGEVLDERADVYALGALLYHVLAGRPPFEGDSTEAILERVMAGTPAPLAARVPDLAPELATIVATAMAARPADRYPTAKEMAADLKRFQTGQLVGAHRYSTWQLVRRWVGRHKAVLGVTAAALVTVAVIATILIGRVFRERDRAEAARAVAEAARQEADQRRAGAEKLIDYMLVTLRDRVVVIGKLDLLQGLGDAVVAYYKSVAGDSDATALAQRARALAILIGVEQSKGDYDAADRITTEAVGLAERAAKLAPTDEVVQGVLAIAVQHAGDSAMRKKDWTGAAADFERARSTDEALANAHPGNLRWRRNLAADYSKIAVLRYQQNDLDGAIRANLSNRDASKRVADADPKDVIARLAWAQAEMNVGFLVASRQRWDDAIAAYERARAIQEKVLADDPANADAASQLGQTLGNESMAQRSLGKNEDADATIDRYLELRRRLMAVDENNVESRRALIGALRNAGEAAVVEGRIERAIAMSKEAVANDERVDAQLPKDVGAQSDHATDLRDLGYAQQRDADYAAALSSYQAAGAIAAAEAQQLEDNPAVALFAGARKCEIGEALFGLGRVADAIASERACVAIVDQVTATLKPPDSYFGEHLRGYAREKLGEAEQRTGDRAAAERDFTDEVAFDEEVAKGQPSDGADSDVTSGQQRLGELLLAKGDRAGATEVFTKALATRVRLAAQAPGNADWQIDAAHSYLDLSQVTADHAQARALAAKGRDLLAALAANGRLSPDVRDVQAQLERAAK